MDRQHCKARAGAGLSGMCNTLRLKHHSTTVGCRSVAPVMLCPPAAGVYTGLPGRGGLLAARPCRAASCSVSASRYPCAYLSCTCTAATDSTGHRVVSSSAALQCGYKLVPLLLLAQGTRREVYQNRVVAGEELTCNSWVEDLTGAVQSLCHVVFLPATLHVCMHAYACQAVALSRAHLGHVLLHARLHRA